ncbi:hypothetical protein BDR06DRAFT_883937 [Suillus hirtellus]|nr:hypothetical protein BDR06DRAFT_883937 [Suillus hirtellus]
MLCQSDLKGFKAPGMTYRIVVTMFSNNTTVYLTNKDNFETPNNILNRWCNASRAKFNKSKTEVIPIGTKEYCQNLLKTRKLNEHSTPILEDVNITQDKTATKILGAWVRNGTNEHNIWSPTLEKIDASLKRWEKCHPTVEGQKIIIQCTIGGMTQYLIVVQGMPKEIEKTLTNQARNFI